MTISDFPFFLIDNRDTSKLLVGYDFISSCDVIQPNDSDMSFYNFDIDSMRSKMYSKNMLNLLSLE